MSRWELASAIWSLAELGNIANEALIALIQLKLIDEGALKGERRPLIQKIRRAGEIIDKLLEELRVLSSLFDEYTPVDKIASPVLREFLNEYGIANARDAMKQLNDLRSRLDNILEGKFTPPDVEGIRRFLEAVSRATTAQIDRLRYVEARGSPWEV